MRLRTSGKNDSNGTSSLEPAAQAKGVVHPPGHSHEIHAASSAQKVTARDFDFLRLRLRLQ
jgi:hypothetical protein